MFSKINRKIRLNIILFLLLFLAIETIVVIFSINGIIYRNFTGFAEENIDLNINNFDFYIDLATNAANTITSDPDIITKVKNHDYSLSSLKLSATSIMGVTLYDVNGGFYNSFEIASVLPLYEMLKNHKINDFISDSASDNCFSVRTTELAKIYNNNIYDASYGIITYITKIRNLDHEVIGYLFVDISPKYIYTNYFNYDSYAEFGGTESFIVFDKVNYLKNSSNAAKASYLPEADYSVPVISRDHKYLILSKKITNLDVWLVSLIPLTNYYDKIINASLPIILVAMLLALVAIQVGKRTSKSIIGDLSDLNLKMMQAETYLKN